MKIIKSNIFIGVFFFVLGIGAALGAQRLVAKPGDLMELDSFSHKTKKMNTLFNQLYGDDFFRGTHREITKREDKDFIYYDVGIKDLNKEKLKVKVENGQITISGQVERESEENGNGSYFSSSFHRSFPAPPELDANKVQMEPSKDKITLKFPKISS